jgi:hypothetical protein
MPARSYADPVVVDVVIACGAVVMSIGLAALLGRRPDHPRLTEPQLTEPQSTEPQLTERQHPSPRSVSEEAEEWLRQQAG